MGWERRGNGLRYYYQYVPVDGMLAETYCGGGIAGELAYQGDLLLRAEQRARAEKKRLHEQRLADVEKAIVAFADATDYLRQLAIGSQGVFLHTRSEWRRKRRWQRKGRTP
jgi:hypothetical protein